MAVDASVADAGTCAADDCAFVTFTAATDASCVDSQGCSVAALDQSCGSVVENVTAFGHERAAAMREAVAQLLAVEATASATDAAADAAGEEVLARAVAHREAGLQLDSARLVLKDSISGLESEAAAVAIDAAAAAVDAAAHAL
jgi:hypothetical protein